MEFKKINEDKFQCLLYEEDLEYNNITLDDFFRNDTEKIHNLLEVIMDEAHKNIGVELGGGVMSLQLAPQPDHSILLTVSSGKEDFGNMLKQAGERAAKALGIEVMPEQKPKHRTDTIGREKSPDPGMRLIRKIKKKLHCIHLRFFLFFLLYFFPLYLVISIILMNTIPAMVEIIVAQIAGSTTAAGFTEPYWLR